MTTHPAARPPRSERRRSGLILTVAIVVALVAGLIVLSTIGVDRSAASFSGTTDNTNQFTMITAEEIIATASWWLDSSQTNTLFTDTGCTSGSTGPGSNVHCWADAQTPGQRVILDATNTGTSTVSTSSFNGVFPVHMFDSHMLGPDVFGGSLSDTSIFVVYREVSKRQSFAVNINGFDRTTTGRFTIHLRWTDGTIYFDPGSITPNRVAITATPDLGVPSLFAGWKDSVAAANGARVNFGADSSSTGYTTGTTTGGLLLGDSADIEFAEIVIFPRRLSLPEERIVEGYLGDKWAI